MLIPIASAVLPKTGNRSFGFQRDTHIHNGIDLPARDGTPIVAPAAGTVRYATREWAQGFSGYGRVVVIEHAQLGAWTLYAHLEQPLVTVGQRVNEGDPIGTVGRTKYSRDDHASLFDEGGAHLHFEVSPHAYPQPNTRPRIDPVAWLANNASALPAPVPEPDGSRAAEIPFGEERSSQASLCCPSCGSRLVLNAERAHE